MTSSPPSANIPDTFKYTVTHIFFPAELPSKNDYTTENDLSLTRAVCAAAHTYTPHLSGTSEEALWYRITKMLDNLQASIQSERLDRDHIIMQLHGMQIGDILTLFIRSHNAATILTRRENCTLFESFEVSPNEGAVEKASGSLICSYPRSAVEIPNKVFDDGVFQFELAKFLSLPGAVDPDSPLPPFAQSQYITVLLTGILRGVGRTPDLAGIIKRIRDNVGQWPSHKYPYQDGWRRSSLWLLIRVAIQMSVDRSTLGRTSYKRFVLYFICSLARDGYDANLSSDMLHLMTFKIFRRLNKFGSTPDWLSEIALKTCTDLREILDARWKRLNVPPSPFWVPTRDELIRDTKLSLRNSHEYIRNTLKYASLKSISTPFHPSHRPRRTLQNFLSSNGVFFDEAHNADPDITLYNVERSVEQEIEDWLACVTDVDDACVQIEILIDKYVTETVGGSPEDTSNRFLTMIELFIALDKLVVKKIPMLADYSPEVPLVFLEKFCLCKTTSLHRLSCAYQYLLARHSRSHPGWSVLSDDFTEDSFPVRYYDQSPYLQQLKACIEQEMIKKVVGHASHQVDCEDIGLTSASNGQQEQSRRQLAQEDAKVSRLPLPALPLHAKAVVFELQGPVCIHIWRSVVAQIHHCTEKMRYYIDGYILLADVPALQPYLIERQGPPLSVQISPAYSEVFQSQNYQKLCYLVRHRDGLFTWQPCWKYRHHEDHLEKYVNSTCHTSNDVLAAQAGCPADLSLDEFIVFGHLRSGGLLQWLNVLQGLHSRALNLHRNDVRFLLARAAFQVGPHDLNTGTWIWHQELQDASFCNTILDELDSLVMGIGARSIDGVLMSTVSLLLTRILASSPSEDVLERAVILLWNVRKKTFSWVQDLAYDLTMAPMNKERANLLWDMASTCRRTFDVDPTALHNHFHSAEDVDALLSCTFFIHTLGQKDYCATGSQLLFEHDTYLSHALEETLRDAILADPSDFGVDLAVTKVFASYRPGAYRWEQLQYPNSRWLTGKTKAIRDQPSQTVHINLLNGSLRVDGQLCGGLPPELRKRLEIFGDQGFFVTPSNLPGMDFMTLAITSNYRMHFSLRDNKFMVRAQCSQTNEILELIPSEKFRGDLPDALVRGHLHWLSLSTSTIEIRPFGEHWERSSKNWMIDCTSGQYRAYKGCETLVDIQSPTSATISKCFRRFCRVDAESPLQETLLPDSWSLLITIDQSASERRLSVTLPDYGLSFFVNEREELESYDFRDMVYDENQSVEALYGLENFVVLRPKTYPARTSVPAALIPRRVLIPNFLKVCYGHQDQVFIRKRTSNQPPYYAYDVDTELGCLTGNGSLASKRFLAYLHATTTCYRPDPLTGKTGVQAALWLLQSAGCRSIMKLRALDDDAEVWKSMVYPQINAAHDEICNRYYWKIGFTGVPSPDSETKRALQRAAHLIPSKMEDCVYKEYFLPELDLELEDIISATASAIHRWSTNSIAMNIISNWAELWTRVDTHADTLVQKMRNILKKEETRQQFPLLFLIPTIAYCSPCHQTAFLSMLVTFSMELQPHLGNLLIHAECKISDGYRPTEGVLSGHIYRSCVKEYFMKFDTINATVEHLLKYWPCDILPTISLDPRYWDVAALTTSLQQLFSSCHRNWNLKEQLVRVLTEPGLPTRPRHVPPILPVPNEYASSQISLDQLLSNRPAPELPCYSTLPRDSCRGDKTSGLSNRIPALDQLFSSLQTNSAFQREYLAILETSAGVHKEDAAIHSAPARDHINALRKYYTQCRDNYMDALSTLRGKLGPTTGREEVLSQLGHWPTITADVLLGCLASTSPINLHGRWKKCLVSFALLLLELQRARRLLRFALEGLEEEFTRELGNEQCNGWNPEEHPDWLLIQIQGDFLIRRTQAETAIEMISPQSGQNTVMQVNMGEGKSSVIIPIVAASLADGKQLVRVIVPKVLTVQMFDLLVARLGGLANRPIYHLPFSRTPGYYNGEVIVSLQVDLIEKIITQCIAERGILLLQPEHIVSLKLMSIEEQIRASKLTTNLLTKHQKSIYRHIKTALSLETLPEDGLVGSIFRWVSQSPNQSRLKDSTWSDDHNERSEAVHGALDSASKWVNFQKWIHSRARDILDESDEILHPRFQLTYTIGLEQHMDGYPDRWSITQQVLRLVKECAPTLSRIYPNSMGYERGPPGSFPYIHIIRASDVGQCLISMIVEDVMAGRLRNFNFQNLPPALRDGIRSFISDEDVFQVPDTVRTVEEYAKNSYHPESCLWSGLLLLRGLLASRILLFALAERRWRVDYGPVLQLQHQDDDGINRYDGSSIRPIPTKLAVPYRAKDVPAPNTQFGHPDLAIILTCLSYYYAGLTEEQLRVSFEILLDQHDPFMEYTLWIEDYDRQTLPDALRTLSNINLKSSEQWDNVTFPLFSRNQAVVDFYLSQMVFPKEAKQFPWKLYGCSWDIAEHRERLTTGFSGTNDTRWLLPLSVTQHDLDHQRGTNAKVLAHLLQPENNFYMVTHENGERHTTLGLLRLVDMQRPEINVLLDVGAQILDFSNRQVAEAWLGIASNAAGAVYFNEKDDLMVLARNGINQPLSSSPLSQQLGNCVVYLDHAHTRGTDLNFPVGLRAAVTLGPKVTKDALVQGCMRMRRLSRGHSVMFFAPLGVDHSIRAVTSKNDPTTTVTTVDILCWAIYETWTDIQQRAPYWAQQGLHHKTRYDAWSRFCNDDLTLEQLLGAWLQPDADSLANLYAPREIEDVQYNLSAAPGVQQRCKDLGVLSIPRGQLEQEQEREVHREREREREVELPPEAEPEEHFLHPDVVSFVRTGVIPPLHSGSAFLPVFTTLEKSSAATRDADVWSPCILATADFAKTIKPESTQGTMDQYLRPVQWILSNKTDREPVLVLLSPFEAIRLMPDIKASEHVYLHLYAPRVSQSMKPSEDLRLYSIPPLPSDWTPPWDLIDQLNVFAGQLYLRDNNSYLRLCRFLGVPTKESPSNTTNVRRNLFNIPGSFEEIEITFSHSPLPFVMALLAIRNRGRPFDQTDMGKILQGQILTEKDFKAPTSVVSDNELSSYED